VEAPALSRGFAALVMLATFALVGWLTLQTARAVQAELEAQATRKSILISRSLERAILNLKNTATALSHSTSYRSMTSGTSTIWPSLIPVARDVVILPVSDHDTSASVRAGI
jgi:hypothetical protein